jgi:hypothetical protein
MAGLTASFGWKSADVWQQHDVQGACEAASDSVFRAFVNLSLSYSVAVTLSMLPLSLCFCAAHANVCLAEFIQKLYEALEKTAGDAKLQQVGCFGLRSVLCSFASCSLLPPVALSRYRSHHPRILSPCAVTTLPLVYARPFAPVPRLRCVLVFVRAGAGLPAIYRDLSHAVCAVLLTRSQALFDLNYGATNDFVHCQGCDEVRGACWSCLFYPRFVCMHPGWSVLCSNCAF